MQLYIHVSTFLLIFSLTTARYSEELLVRGFYRATHAYMFIWYLEMYRPLLKYCKYIKVHVERSVSRVWKVYLKNYTSGLDGKMHYIMKCFFFQDHFTSSPECRHVHLYLLQKLVLKYHMWRFVHTRESRSKAKECRGASWWRCEYTLKINKPACFIHGRKPII